MCISTIHQKNCYRVDSSQNIFVGKSATQPKIAKYFGLKIPQFHIKGNEFLFI